MGKAFAHLLKSSSNELSTFQKGRLLPMYSYSGAVVMSFLPSEKADFLPRT